MRDSTARLRFDSEAQIGHRKDGHDKNRIRCGLGELQ